MANKISQALRSNASDYPYSRPGNVSTRTNN